MEENYVHHVYHNTNLYKPRWKQIMYCNDINNIVITYVELKDSKYQLCCSVVETKCQLMQKMFTLVISSYEEKLILVQFVSVFCETSC